MPWLKKSLKFEMLKLRREDIIRIKGMLLKKIVGVSNGYPEPTKENTTYRNTHILIDIWEQFFKYEDNPHRKNLFEAIRRIFIDEYEHDPYYRYRIDWFLEQIFASNWEPRRQGQPSQLWKEPRRH